MPCVVQASNVTVDLNGYTIFGLGGTDVLHQASGIKVEQQNNVTIFSSRPGGTIRDFFHGVWILGGKGNQVGNLNIIDNNDGVPPGGGNGIVMQNAVNSKVVANFVDRSGGFGGISIFNDRRVPPCCPQLAEANLIKDNVVRMPPVGPQPSASASRVAPGTGSRATWSKAVPVTAFASASRSAPPG
jgi:hypothetical protein